MGLFADTMEQVRDNGFDTGNMLGWSSISPKKLREAAYKKREREKQRLLESVRSNAELLKNKRDDVVKRSRSQIEQDLNELETSKYFYRVSEKNLLMVKRKTNFQSSIIEEIVEGLLDFYEETCDSITEIQNEVIEKMGTSFSPKANEVNESALKKEISKTIIEMLDSGIENGLPLSRELFRNVVKDLEYVIGMLEYDGKVLKKLEVEQYFEEKCKKQKSMIVCQNCGREMLTGIPYCFNCFDGRYS